jgi:hypothetical protein
LTPRPSAPILRPMFSAFTRILLALSMTFVRFKIG